MREIKLDVCPHPPSCPSSLLSPLLFSSLPSLPSFSLPSHLGDADQGPQAVHRRRQLPPRQLLRDPHRPAPPAQACRMIRMGCSPMVISESLSDFREAEADKSRPRLGSKRLGGEAPPDARRPPAPARVRTGVDARACAQRRMGGVRTCRRTHPGAQARPGARRNSDTTAVISCVAANTV